MGCVLIAFRRPLCALWMCLPNIKITKKTHVDMLSPSAFCFQCSVLGELPSVLCCEASVVACLHASDWARVQTQSIVVLWWSHKRWGHSLWLFVCLLPCYASCFLVLFTAFLTTWPRVNGAKFGPALMAENCIWDSYQKDFFLFYIYIYIRQAVKGSYGCFLHIMEKWTITTNTENPTLALSNINTNANDTLCWTWRFQH